MRASNKICFIVLLICVFMIGSGARAQDFSSITSSTTFSFARNLAFGSYGNDVSALQQFLIDSGFLKIVTPTGYFGPLTRTAVSTWQALAGVYPPAGFFGPISRRKINATAPQAPISAIGVQSSVATTTTSVATTSMAIANNGDGSPVRLMIPKLNIDAGFQYTGLKSDGTMEIPTNIVDVGWYTGSPHPGEEGNAIITGHVAQIRNSTVTKQGVFYNLNELLPGDKLYVLNDKGQTITFVVRESRLYDPTADATDVFISQDNGAHLVLITCEGTWNQSQLSYTQRLVIFTDAVQ